MSEPEPFPALRCRECETLFGHRPAACRACGSETLKSVELPGRGRLYASTVIRVPGADNQGEEPYRIGLVDVGEGDAVRVTARVEGDTDLTFDPELPVTYVGRRDGAFVFRPT